MTARRLVARVTTVSSYALRVAACLLAYSVAFLISRGASRVSAERSWHGALWPCHERATSAGTQRASAGGSGQVRSPTVGL